jgi:hypothetical protein
MDIVIVKELDNNRIVENNEPQTYIKSQGMSQTIIQKPGVNNVNQINWDADYNGQLANLNLDVNTNGKKDNFTLQLSKGDLENLLNIPSVEKPLENRLEDDFLVTNDFAPSLQYKPQPYLFRPSVYPKSKTCKVQNRNIETQIKDELSKMSTQDEDEIKSEIKNLLQLKKKLQHPHKGKHNHSHYKSHRNIPPHYTQHHRKTKMHTPVKRHRLTTTKKKREYKTPSPKTMRIHLTEDHNVTTTSKKKSSSRKKRKTSSPKKDPSLLERISELVQN